MNPQARHELDTTPLAWAGGSVFTYQTANGTARFVISEEHYPFACPMILWRPNSARTFNRVDSFAWNGSMTMEGAALVLDAEHQRLIDLAAEARWRSRGRGHVLGGGRPAAGRGRARARVRARRPEYVGGTGGHLYAARIDGDPEHEHVDLRVRPDNRQRRSNMRDRAGKRSHVTTGRSLAGTHYDRRQLRCTKCGMWKSRGQFANMAVEGRIRHQNGCNIRCRDCQPAEYQYEHGYKLEGFVERGGDADPEDDGNAGYDGAWKPSEHVVVSDDETIAEVTTEDELDEWVDDDELADLVSFNARTKSMWA